MNRIAIGAFAVLAACGRDVVLGADLDAAIDAPPVNSPFTPGSYMLQTFDPPQVDCQGTLTGSDASFTSLTHSDVGVTDGVVMLATPADNVLDVSGTLIASGWGQSQLELTPSDDPTVWQASVSAVFGSGPLGTQRVGMGLALLVATAASPSGIDTAVGVFYETTDTNGMCNLLFSATLTKL